ncbi:MAG: 30S ribosomal protein S9 [Planctomycetota bacterium]|jgi:small subunit ribosomal protein S9
MVEAKTFVWGTGRRKSAIARVRIAPGSGRMVVNRREWRDYFPTRDSQVAVRLPLRITESEDHYDVFVNVKGGGVQSQADAVRHGLSRALASANPDLEQALRGAGLMTRDARMKERKKYGQRGARARFQFSKR